ncbi:probable methyltransferase-like protein 24 [Amia ocellicauda]|uniref:probable methyltransferase-like protein 24 n=1 Tax=Amia ocellicauda TaxID=2972642 RepID=UPI003464B4A0
MRCGRGLRWALLHACLLLGPLLLLLHIFVGIQVPGARGGSEDPGVAFTIISIDNSRREGEPGGSDPGSPPERRAYPRGWRTGRPEFVEEDPTPQTDYIPPIYEDENEVMTRQGGARREIELQPWVDGRPSFTAEVERFIAYITTPQVQCGQELRPSKQPHVGGPGGPWAVCLEGWFLPMKGLHPCVAYSFSMDQKDKDFVSVMAAAGCEVHQFDPGRRDRQTPGEVHQHQTWLDWRNLRAGHSKATPRHQSRHSQRPDSVRSSCSCVCIFLSVAQVEYVNADLESAEWRVVEGWVLDGTLRQIQQLVLTVHLQWAGFEVAGSSQEVVRFWYSVMRELHASGYRLLHSARGPGRAVLRHMLANASSTYTLSWVNTRWSY